MPATDYDIYTDGGCIGKNPSSVGGTWAWCLVDRTGRRVDCDSGVLEPKDIGLASVTNNFTELYAAIMALEAAPPNWEGILYTDSQVTLFRLTRSNKFKGLPIEVRDRCLHLRKWRRWTVLLLGGHPTRNDLEVGYNKRGRPVSRHNKWCDERCTNMAKRFLSRRTTNAGGD